MKVSGKYSLKLNYQFHIGLCMCIHILILCNYVINPFLYATSDEDHLIGFATNEYKFLNNIKLLQVN